jgi:predicted DNA-binding transcriptional regulator YafY
VSTTVEVTVTNRAALRAFVLGFLEHVEILEPADVRAEMVAWLEAAVRT